MREKIKSQLSVWVLVLISIVYVIEFLSNERPRHDSVLEWDVQEYYMYLPAVFIYGDLDYRFTGQLPPELGKHYWFSNSPSGKPVARMSIGMSVAYTPFFLLAHIAAPMLGYPANGFSRPYQFLILLSGFFYSLMGLLLLRKVLKRYFPDSIAAITLLVLGLGTNLFYYSTIESAMSHAILFGYFSMFLYYTMRWYETKRLRHLLGLAFAVGMASLIRPISVSLLLVFALYGISSLKEIKPRINTWLNHWLQLLAAGLLIALIAFPQMLYWKMQTGSWVFYSYGDQHFFFNDPKILQGLFSYRKGWLVYTPVMLLAIIGFVNLYRRQRGLFWPVLLFSVFNMYVVFSWWCWWYGGSFGMRALIESYVFLALPMAAFWQGVYRQRLALSAAAVFTVLAIGLNIFQVKQYRAAIIHWDSMTGKAYWYVFGRLRYAPDDYLQKPDYDGAMKDEEGAAPPAKH